MHPRNRSRQKSARREISPFTEIKSFVGHEIPRCAIRASELADVVSGIAVRANIVLIEVHSESPASELCDQAHALNGILLHLASTLLELQALAGKLETLASAKQMLGQA